MATNTSTPDIPAVGDPCPNGCTSGVGREKTPTLLSVSQQVDENGNAVDDPDGSISCPDCWDFFGFVNPEADTTARTAP